MAADHADRIRIEAGFGAYQRGERVGVDVRRARARELREACTAGRVRDARLPARERERDQRAQARGGVAQAVRVHHPAPVTRYDITSPCTSSDQPSSATNSSSLNGTEIVVGEIICMPSASRMFATSRSTTMNTI